MTRFDEAGRPITRFAEALRRVSPFHSNRLKTKADDRLDQASLVDRQTGLPKKRGR